MSTITTTDEQTALIMQRSSVLRTVYGLVPQRVHPLLTKQALFARDLLRAVLTVFQRVVQTPIYLLVRNSWTNRALEIGPGPRRIQGFETLNVVGGRNVDFIWDADRHLPFRTGTFRLIYASHILEHIPWYRTDEVLREWVRLLQPGGRLELWVPDGLKICRAFVAAEDAGSEDFRGDQWYRFNPEEDPCLWAAGRVFSYGDGNGTKGHFNWHLALFSPRYLERALRQAGCSRVEQLDRSQVRGHDHGWINLGMVGIK